MASKDLQVHELVTAIERGDLRLPEMQRRYVWRTTRVRDLLDSLYRGYPSGAILMWRTYEEMPTREFAVQQQQSDSSHGMQLLLDGQQRLTSLAAVTRGLPVKVRGRVKPIVFLFNLDHPDTLDVVTEVHEDIAADDVASAEAETEVNNENEDDEDDAGEDDTTEDEDDTTEDELLKRLNRMTFVAYNNQLAQLPQWVKVTDVFNPDYSEGDILKSAGVTNLDSPNYERYSARLKALRAIRNYGYRVDELGPELTYDEVTEIFVRVNSLGAKLRGSDLALAQITAKWPGSLKQFEDFQKQCARTEFNLDLGVHIRNLVVFATGQARFQRVSGLGRESLEQGWRNGCKGMQFALNFAKHNALIDSTASLSSPFLLITLALYAHKQNGSLSKQQAGEIRKWLLCANAKGRYSRGSSETILNQDLAALREGGDTEKLFDLLRQQVGRLEVTDKDLEGRNQRSALFKTMFLAFREAGAKDWRSQIALAHNLTGAQHRLQFHHIFPKAKLKGKYERREIDDIANLCFISGKANREIAAKPPTQYIPEIIAQNEGEQADADKAFNAQCIPLDPELLDIKNYKAFIAKRRELIAARLNEFLGEAKPK